MAYSHYQIEERVSGGIAPVDLATDTSYVLVPGYQPMTLRAAAVVVTTTTATSAITVTITRRPTAGSDSSAEAIDVITVPSGTAAGSVVYVDGLEAKVSPGQDIEFQVGGTGTGNGHIIAFLEPSWEHPSNNSDMIESA